MLNEIEAWQMEFFFPQLEETVAVMNQLRATGYKRQVPFGT